MVFYNSAYTQPDDLQEAIQNRLLRNQYDVPIFLENVLDGSTYIENLMNRYGINRTDVTNRPIFVIEFGSTKQKFRLMNA